jgi:hypothetical protein
MADDNEEDKLADLTIGAAQGNPFAIRALKIMGQEMVFQEKIWSEDPKFWEDVKKDPVKFNARMRQSCKFLSIFGHSRPANPVDSKRRESADTIASEGLSEKEIEEIAFGNNGNAPDKT